MSEEFKQLVSTQWLEEHLRSKEKLKILDASWYLPSENRNPKKEFLVTHIPGSHYFDIDLFSDPNHQLPHMVPSVERFCNEISKLGVKDEDHIVFYDGLGMFSAARAWWLLKLFGFNRVSVLDGGLPKWISEKRVVTSEISASNVGHITPKFVKQLVCDWKKVKTFLPRRSRQIIDARSSERFRGLAAEPRPGLRSGHIPGSTNICYKELINEDHTIKSQASLLAIFSSKGIDLSLPIITSCGSGVTAAILFLALELVGVKDVAIYDGSWAEWGQRDDLDVETEL